MSILCRLMAQGSPNAKLHLKLINSSFSINHVPVPVIMATQSGGTPKTGPSRSSPLNAMFFIRSILYLRGSVVREFAMRPDGRGSNPDKSQNYFIIFISETVFSPIQPTVGPSILYSVRGLERSVIKIGPKERHPGQPWDPPNSLRSKPRTEYSYELSTYAYIHVLGS